jgi:phosphatidylserine/phosphatidylglycerophosphate/cardiolipin synthase-like enzyme
LKHCYPSFSSLHLFGVVCLLAGLSLGSCAPEESIEVIFCDGAEPRCSERVIEVIEGAQDTLECAVYTFTLEPVAEALAEAVARGVQVWVVYELEQESDNVTEILESGGVFAKADGNGALMHHKFVIADANVVATGSFNWTWSADTGHDENLMILESPGLAAHFQDEFQRIWSEAK